MKFVICGSISKNNASMIQLAEALKKKYTKSEVTYPGMWMPHTHEPEGIAKMRELYFDKLHEADLVIVVNTPVDYIGVETSIEIGYALAIGAKVVFTGESKIDAIQGLLADYSAQIFRWPK